MFPADRPVGGGFYLFNVNEFEVAERTWCLLDVGTDQLVVLKPPSTNGPSGHREAWDRAK